MFKLKKGYQPGVYVPLMALFLVVSYYAKILLEIIFICIGF